jgi:hypothetical protein
LRTFLNENVIWNKFCALFSLEWLGDSFDKFSVGMSIVGLVKDASGLSGGTYECLSLALEAISIGGEMVLAAWEKRKEKKVFLLSSFKILIIICISSRYFHE